MDRCQFQGGIKIQPGSTCLDHTVMWVAGKHWPSVTESKALILGLEKRKWQKEMEKGDVSKDLLVARTADKVIVVVFHILSLGELQ